MSHTCHRQAKGEVDQLSKLTRDRSNLAFDSATVSIAFGVSFSPDVSCRDLWFLWLASLCSVS